MLDNLSEKIREWYQRAEDCERKAREQNSPALRADFLDSARRWTVLARSYESSDRLTRFTFKPRQQ